MLKSIKYKENKEKTDNLFGGIKEKVLLLQTS